MGYMYALSWKLLIIGLLSEYFAALLKRLYLKKTTTKCSIFLHQLYFFLMGRSRTFLEIGIKFHLGRTKGSSKRWVWGEKPKMRWFLFAKFPLLKKIHSLSHKLLSYKLPNHHHYEQHAPKNLNTYFQVILNSSPWSKTTLCIFKEQIWLPNSKWYGKNKLYFDQEEMLNMVWYSMQIGFLTYQFQWHRFWGCIFRCLWVMGYMYAFPWKLSHGTIFRIFCNITQNTTPEKNSQKMFHISSLIVIFSYGKVKDIFLRIKDQISSGECKRKG